MSARSVRDPFGATANPDAYVSRSACDAALEQLVAGLNSGLQPVVLLGPGGIGKSFLLQLVSQRVADTYRCVFLPYPMLSLDELCAFVLADLGEKDSSEPRGALLDFCFRTAGDTPLVLVIDDVSSLPVATAHGLAVLIAASGSALRLVASAEESEKTARVLASLAPERHEVRLDAAMDAEETAAYVEARLAWAEAPESVRRRFDAAALERIHEESAGVPRDVNRLADAVVREVTAPGAARLRPAPEPVPPQQPAAAGPDGTTALRELVLGPEHVEPRGAQTGPAPELLLEARDAEPDTAADRALSEAAPELLLDAAHADPGGAHGDEPELLLDAEQEEGFAEEPELLLETDDDATELDLDEDAAGSPPELLLRPEPDAPHAEDLPHAREAATAAELDPGLELGPAPRATLAPRPRVARVLAVAAVVALLAVGAAWLWSSGSVPSLSAPSWQTTTPQAAPAPRVRPSPPPAAALEPVVPAPAPEAQAEPSGEAGAETLAEVAPAAPTAPAAEPIPVHINATPWASVEVDGLDLGYTPLAGVLLAPGPHRFRATLPDDRVIEREIVISADERHIVFE